MNNTYFRTLVWQPGEGPPINLTDRSQGRRLQADGTTGLDMATYVQAQRRIPGRPGAVTTSVNAEPREIDLALLLEARDERDLRFRFRELVRAMRPNLGPGTLLSIHSDGTTRRIACRYVDGLAGDEGSGVTMPGRWRQVVIGLRADDPYAVGDELSASWSLAPSLVGWWPEIPIRLTGGVGGQQTVHNPGDVEAFPTITVSGPGSLLSVTNRTTGKGLTLDYPIPADGPESEITIDTRPGEQKIVNGFGVNLYPYLTDEDPSLWSLQPGDNVVEVRLSGAEAGSTVTVSFQPLYESL